MTSKQFLELLKGKYSQYTRKDKILSIITGRMICDNMSNYMSGRPSQQTQRQSKHYMYVAAYWADNY